MERLFKTNVMKQELMKAVNRIYLFVAAMLFNLVAFAQEKSMDVNVDVNGGESAGWYANPWVWIVGAAVFILLLVAIIRGGGRTSD
jgi:hypothetical protein